MKFKHIITLGLAILVANLWAVEIPEVIEKTSKVAIKAFNSDEPYRRAQPPEHINGKMKNGESFSLEMGYDAAAKTVSLSKEKFAKKAPEDFKEFCRITDEAFFQVMQESPYCEAAVIFSKEDARAIRKACYGLFIYNTVAVLARYYDNGRFAKEMFKVLSDHFQMFAFVDHRIFILDYDPKLALDPQSVLLLINSVYADAEKMSIDEMEGLYIPLNDISGKLIATNDFLILTKYTETIENLATRCLTLGMADNSNIQRWTAIAGKFADLQQRSNNKMRNNLMGNIYKAAEQVKEINRQK